MARAAQDIRNYLLGRLDEAEEEHVELRLLNDPDFGAEFDMIVDEIVDEYVANKFAGEDRKQLEEYFFKSPERRNKLKFALALSEMVAATDNPKRSYRLYLSIAATLLVVIGGFYIWRIWSSRNEIDKGLAALQSAVRDERPLEARISSLQYAPYVTSRGPRESRINQKDLRRAELNLTETLERDKSSAAYHALGKVFLAKKDFDLAIEQFAEALKSDPNNAQLHNDLGVAWLEKGRSDQSGKEPGKGLVELGRSLENFNRALAFDPNLLEALFNRALSRQLQRLYAQATLDWQEYLKRDSTSQWADEAREKLKLIEQQEKSSGDNAGQERPLDRFLSAYGRQDDQAAWNIYRRSFSSAGNTITKELIDTFLSKKDPAKSRSYLSALEYAGRLLQINGNDPYELDIATFYRSATPQTQEVLVRARADLRNGYDLFRGSKTKDAIELLSRSQEAFTSVGDYPEALAAECAIAHAANVQPDAPRSKLILARIVPISEAKGYKWLLSQSLFERAYLQSNLSNYSEAIDDSVHSHEVSLSIKDSNGAMASLVQLASIYLFLNDSEQSLSLVEQGFETIEMDPSGNMSLWGMFTAAALSFDNLGLNLAAFDYQNEALDLALNSRIPLYISRSHEYLGRTYGELQQYEEGLQHLRRAYEEGRALAQDRNGQNMMAHASLNIGDLYRASRKYGQALDAYNESIRLYEGLDFPPYRYLAHKGKLMAMLADHDETSAAGELPIVLKLFEEYRRRILEERQRNVFFDREQDVYDLAIDFACSKTNDPRGAFNYSETSRSRSLLDLLQNGGIVVQREDKSDLRVAPRIASSLRVDELMPLMPPDAQILQYSVLKDKVIIWVISEDSFTARVFWIDSTKLNKQIVRTIRAITNQQDSIISSELMALHDVLIKPVADLLDGKKLLCIVPDKELCYVPFGALISSASQRYLVQDYRITLAPSSSVFIYCSASAKKRAQTQNERLLVVGNPSFDRDAYPAYRDLPVAEREADGVAALYKSAQILKQKQATVEDVKAGLSKSEVVHLAAHYVIDPRSTLSSRLLLTKRSGSGDQKRNSELAARDVFQMNLSHTRLVVLSSCQTGIDQQYGGEGPVSFARQFIAAGVPVVVASLWPIDDSEATAQLMIAFHKFRKSGESTAAALRKAQEEMIGNPNVRYRQPYYWASFMAIGGDAAF